MGHMGPVGTNDVFFPVAFTSTNPCGLIVSGRFHEETDAADARAHSQRSSP